MKKTVFFLCLVMCALFSIAQSRVITGKVTDVDGSPVPHASVLLKGTRIGTVTALDGTFKITLPPTSKTLTIYSLNYVSQEVAIGEKSTVYVALQPSSENLNEVVVTGYGVQKKSEATSSIGKVSGDQVANVPFSSVDQTLQGKVAGLQSVTSSGQPGANQQIRIRGIGSYSASAQPLFVLDGIQINSGDLSRETSTTNVLAQLNPDDIESISVLKDAAATSIYGARGGNGVIVITTKKGKSGATKFNASGEIGTNMPGDLPAAGKPLGAADWLTLFKESYVNAYLISNPTAATATAQTAAATAASAYGDGTISTDWKSLLLRNGPQQQYNASASGGDAKSQFFFSGGYFHQVGTTIGADLTRYSSVFNFKHIVNKKIDIAMSIQPTFSHQTTFISNSSAFASPTMEYYFARPTSAPFNADGSWNIDRTLSKNFAGLYNPLYIVAHDIHSLDNFSTLGKAEGNYSILPGLKFTTSLGLQYNSLEEFQYNNPIHGDGAAANGRGYAYYTRYFLMDWVNQLNYHLNFGTGQNYSLDATAGYESISSNGYFITAAATNYPPTTLPDAALGATPATGSNSNSNYNFASIFSRASVGYKGKYIVSGSFRRDGSSRFGPSNVYGSFPSVGVSWNIYKEDFMAKLPFISDLKIRGSYGTSGNAEIGNYTYRQTFGYGVNYNSQPGGGFNTLGNIDLQWERSIQTDVGLEGSLFKNRLSFVVDYYNKKSDHLLFAQPISLVTGFPTITKNIGAVSNKGYEITLNGTPVSTHNFSWDVSFNLTHNKNMITAIPPGQTQIINGVNYIAPGHDIQEFYGKLWAGVDPATGNPQWFTDGTKKTVTTQYGAAANVPMGLSGSPKYYGGFSNTFSYKGFSLAADLYYNYGNYFRDSWANYYTDEVNPSYGKLATSLARWQKPGDITDIPKLIYGATNTSTAITNSNSVSFSSRFLYKGDFVRLRNITLGYTIPPAVAKKMHLSTLRFYARGTNLWTKTYDKRLTLDPEQGVNSQSNLNVLYNKALTFGLTLGL